VTPACPAWTSACSRAAAAAAGRRGTRRPAAPPGAGRPTAAVGAGRAPGTSRAGGASTVLRSAGLGQSARLRRVSVNRPVGDTAFDGTGRPSAQPAACWNPRALTWVITLLATR
jgi:hypothetical protein